MCREIEKESSLRRLLGDQQGAIMVAGLFMSIFILGMLYYLIGIGDAVIHRERMQDAADAAALSAAVVHARGMNLIVLINMVMAALLAVLVGIKMVETIALAAIVLCAALAWITAGASTVAIVPLNEVRDMASTAYDALKEPIFNLLKVLHQVAKGVRVVVPAGSEIKVVDTVVSHYRPSATVGFVILPRVTLPTEDDKFEVLCDKAGEVVGEVVAFPIVEPVRKVAGSVVADPIGDVIGGATEALVSALRSWFCGDGSEAVPDITIEPNVDSPALSERQACLAMAKTDPGNAQAQCAKADEQEKRAAFNEQTGNCLLANGFEDESQCGDYFQRVNQARSQCNPYTAKGEVSQYAWQQRYIRLTVTKQEDGTWVKNRTVVDNSYQVFTKQGTPPCLDWYGAGVRYDVPDNSFAWDPTASNSNDPNKSVPVCTFDRNGEACSNYEALYASVKPPPPLELECTYGEVAQILGCKIKTKETFKPDVDESDRLAQQKGKGGQEERVPQKLEEGVELGGKDFQLRSVVIGTQGSVLSDNAETVLKMATWGQKEDGQAEGFRTAKILGQASIAQAEYYYFDADAKALANESTREDERQKWMWNMNWRARFKRFRMTESEGGDSAGTGQNDEPSSEWTGGERASTDSTEACSASGSNDCEKVGENLDFLRGADMVVH